MVIIRVKSYERQSIKMPLCYKYIDTREKRNSVLIPCVHFLIFFIFANKNNCTTYITCACVAGTMHT